MTPDDLEPTPRCVLAVRAHPDDESFGLGAVIFIAEAPHCTSVELVHRHLDRHGDGREGVSDGIANESGWPTQLALYADVVDKATCGLE